MDSNLSNPASHEDRLVLENLRMVYPFGREVEVLHECGRFHGFVAGYRPQEWKVLVRNTRTGKVAGWRAAEVRMIGGTK